MNPILKCYLVFLFGLVVFGIMKMSERADETDTGCTKKEERGTGCGLWGDGVPTYNKLTLSAQHGEKSAQHWASLLLFGF